MRKILKLFTEIYYLEKFKSHLQRVFDKNVDFKNNGLIIVELNSLFGSHIAYSFILQKLKKTFSTNEIGLFKGSFDEYNTNFFLHNLLNKLSLHYYSWYKAMGNSIFLYHKTNYANFIKYRKYLKKIKNNKDLLNFKIDGILYGDLIYDTYLREFNEHTINIKDRKFRFFFYKSIDYYYYCKKLFSENEIKCVILSHAVYLPAILGRIAVNNNKLFYCLSLTHCVNLSKKFFYIENFKEYKGLFLKLPKNVQKEKLKLAKKEIKKKIDGFVTDGFENLKSSTFSGEIKKDLIKKNNKLKILVATHCFTDSPHVHGNFLFNDYYDWIKHLGNISLKTNYDWYIKPHPNEFHQKKNLEVINKFVKKYKKFKIISNNISHYSYIKDIDFILTIDGHIAEEMAYHDKKVIVAHRLGKFGSYKYVINPSTKNNYKNLILNLNKVKKFKINKNEIYLSHCINHIFLHQNYLLKFKDLSNEIGWSKLNEIDVLKYWMKNFNNSKHRFIVKKISNFVDNSIKNKKYNRII